jgi:hypothetical protein
MAGLDVGLLGRRSPESVKTVDTPLVAKEWSIPSYLLSQFGQEARQEVLSAVDADREHSKHVIKMQNSKKKIVEGSDKNYILYLCVS